MSTNTKPFLRTQILETDRLRGLAGDDPENMNSLSNQHCKARLRETTITTSDGTARQRFELLQLTPAAARLAE